MPEYSEPELEKHPGWAADPLAVIPLSQRPKLPPNLPAYRGAGKGNLETLPLARFDARSPIDDINSIYFGPDKLKKKQAEAVHNLKKMYSFVHTVGAAKKLGLPAIPPEDLAALVLKEGRADFGFNGFVPKAPPDVKFRKMLDAHFNLTDEQKQLLGLINYTQRTARRKKVPFEVVWNGLGVNAYGKTGFDYAKDLASHRWAATHPKNREFTKFIRDAYAAGMKNGLPRMQTRMRDTDPYYKSDPYYEYHRPDGKLRPVTTILKNKVKRTVDDIANWFAK